MYHTDKELFMVRAHSPYVTCQQYGCGYKYESNKLDMDLVFTADDLIGKEEDSWVFRVQGMKIYINSEYVVSL